MFLPWEFLLNIIFAMVNIFLHWIFFLISMGNVFEIFLAIGNLYIYLIRKQMLKISKMKNICVYYGRYMTFTCRLTPVNLINLKNNDRVEMRK